MKNNEHNELGALEFIISKLREELEAEKAICWTIEEASKYSRIGINRLRRMTLDASCPFVLMVGDTKRLIKVDAFKAWLNEVAYVA